MNDGKERGMISFIEENIPFEYLSLKHVGAINNGLEDFDSEEVKKWSGAMESYRLETADGQTILHISMDSSSEYKDYFADVWPKALNKVKEMAEKAS